MSTRPMAARSLRSCRLIIRKWCACSRVRTLKRPNLVCLVLSLPSFGSRWELGCVFWIGVLLANDVALWSRDGLGFDLVGRGGGIGIGDKSSSSSSSMSLSLSPYHLDLFVFICLITPGLIILTTPPWTSIIPGFTTDRSFFQVTCSVSIPCIMVLPFCGN